MTGRFRLWLGIQIIVIGMYVAGTEWNFRTYKDGVELTRGKL